MKKFLSALLATLLLLTMLPLGVISVSADEYDGGFYYTVEEGNATISGYGGDEENVVIPSTLGGYSVTAIGIGAFYNCDEMVSVTIPDSVTTIGKEAFYNRDALANVTFPDGLTTIGESAFYDCDALANVTFPDGLTTIGESAFYGCGALANVTFPDGLTTIGESAFYGCNALANVTFPDGLTTIGERAFCGCNALTEVVVPNSVTEIGVSAFNSCSRITAITIPFIGHYADGTGETHFSYIFGSYSPSSSSYGSDTNVPTALKTVNITGNVTTINWEAFRNCNSLRNIVLPDSLTTIGSYAFRGCAITDVWYSASRSKRESISFGSYNDSLTGATWHYFTCSDEHTYDHACDSTCNRCDWTRTVSDHVYDDACDQICNVCGYQRTAPHRYVSATCNDPKTCSVCGVTEGEALGHSYVSSVTEQPTCTADGVRTYTCSACGDSYTESIAVLGHDYAYATCTRPRICRKCGVTEGESLGGHIYTDECDKYCDRCYAERDEYHDYAPATCTKAAVCRVCGARSGSALGHDYDNACDETCNYCDYKRTVSSHSYSDYYCDADCDICGAVRTAPHDYRDTCDIDCDRCGALRSVTHSYDNDCDAYCNVCGTYREVPEHVYSHRCDRDCNVCYAIRDVAHEYSNKCDTTCNYCNSKRQASAHTYESSKVVRATLTKDGYSIKECAECGETYGTKTTINKVGHFTLSTTSYTYNGSAKKPSVTVKDSKGKTISSKHYTVTYASGRKNVGTYKVTVKMKGNYSGTKTLTFKVLPTKTSISKVTGATKALTVKWTKKTTQVTGYQIQYSTSKSFSSYKTKTVSSYKTTTATLSSLSAKKTYYVRVRTYKTVDGKKIYSGWSTVKSAKTK